MRGPECRPLGPPRNPPRRRAHLPRLLRAEQWYLCSLRLLPREKLVLKSGAEVRFHTGTSDVAASFYPLSGTSMEGGNSALIQVKTKTPVVAGPGDHFLLRTLSPVRTVGGGRIVEAIERVKANRPEIRQDLQQRADAILDPQRFVEYCVRRAESLATTEAAIAVRTKIPHARVREILADLAGRQVIFAVTGKDYVHRDTAAEAAEEILKLVADFHRQSPESPACRPSNCVATIVVQPSRLPRQARRLHHKPSGKRCRSTKQFSMRWWRV